MFFFDDENSEESEDSLICATFGQYDGKPITILSMATSIDGKEVLLIVDEEEPTYQLKDGYAHVTDLKQFDDAEMIFDQSRFIEALEAYRQLKATDSIIYDPKMVKYDVGDSVQINGLKDSGRFNYEVQGVTNGHMAVLATCLFHNKLKTHDDCIEMTNMMELIYKTL